MKVTNTRIDILMRAIECSFDRTMTLVRNYDIEEGALEFKVNWSCIGETDSGKAIEFANDLLFISRLADSLNEKCYDFSYDDDEHITSKEWADTWFDNLKVTLDNRHKYYHGTVIKAILTYIEM